MPDEFVPAAGDLPVGDDSSVQSAIPIDRRPAGARPGAQENRRAVYAPQPIRDDSGVSGMSDDPAEPDPRRYAVLLPTGDNEQGQERDSGLANSTRESQSLQPQEAPVGATDQFLRISMSVNDSSSSSNSLSGGSPPMSPGATAQVLEAPVSVADASSANSSSDDDGSLPRAPGRRRLMQNAPNNATND